VEAIFIDTHVSIWLFQKDMKKFSKNAIKLIENNDIIISAMSILELEFLYEINKINYPQDEIISYLQNTIDLKISKNSLENVTKKAVDIKFTRDPFDRIIIADCLVSNLKLLTRDRNILSNFDNAVW